MFTKGDPSLSHTTTSVLRAACSFTGLWQKLIRTEDLWETARRNPPLNTPRQWMLSFKPTFSLSTFTFIQKLFSFSSLSAIKVMSSAYLRLLIFLLAILIPAYSSSSPAFHIMYSAYNLNKQGDNIQPWRTPFQILNQFVVPCLVLTVASWPAYRFLRR